MSAARRGERRATLSLRAWIVLAASVGLIALSGAAVSAAVPDAESSDGVDAHRETASREEVSRLSPSTVYPSGSPAL
ncbi:hypothetical protein ACWC0A_33530 [Streptomyces scopuliridis]